MIRTKIDGKKVTLSKELAQKYSRPGPRYTSYPTAPNWSKNFRPDDFHQALQTSNKKGSPLSLYFHIPFCEERCTFCACSVVATKRHEVAKPYLKALEKEIDCVSEVLAPNRSVVQIHWGGGTPTYLSPEQISELFLHIQKHFQLAPNAEVSIEIDPRVTTAEQLTTLRRLGFNRASLGVQDFETAVQKEAGRIQSEEETARIVETGRGLGFESMNMDLVYGLPKQTQKTFQKTIEKVLGLDPDRIALFNFAYVPWMHRHQQKMDEKDFPSPFAKLEMFCQAIQTFEEAGYQFIGLDHFAKKKDELCKAKREGTMYRNFQGYTTHRECDLVGLGVTSISYVDETFAQNAKKLKDYEERVSKTGLTTQSGLRLSPEDLKRQKTIRELFCHQKTELDASWQREKMALQSFEADGLITLQGNRLTVTPLGRLFLRNIGMVFDTYLKQGDGKFSKTV